MSQFWFVLEQGIMSHFLLVWNQGITYQFWYVSEGIMSQLLFLGKRDYVQIFSCLVNKGLCPSLVLELWTRNCVLIPTCIVFKDYMLKERDYAPLTIMTSCSSYQQFGRVNRICCWIVDSCYIVSCLGEDEWCYWLICLCWPNSSFFESFVINIIF